MNVDKEMNHKVENLFKLSLQSLLDPGLSSLPPSLSGVGGGRHISPSSSPVGVDEFAGLRK